ncbi:MAG: hypothetical protein HY040_26830 [Planctomycetes bacterium]|nr:hypothetical protein [Planctomycetota bacterium]
MVSFARVIGFFAILVLLLPNLAAQDKKNPDKDEVKKDEVKKDEVKKDDLKKDEAKKDDPKTVDTKDKKETVKTDDDKGKKKDVKKAESEERLLQGPKITGKLKRFENNPAKDFTLEIPVVDQQKVAKLQQWKTQDLAAILSDGNIANRVNRMAQHNAEYARKQNTEIYSAKDKDLRVGAGCRFRSKFPPVEYDDKGKLKKWTSNQLAALRGNSKLPGYPIEFDALKPDQFVEVYLPKQANATPAAKNKKKTDDDDLIATRPEAVFILIIQEVPGSK